MAEPAAAEVSAIRPKISVLEAFIEGKVTKVDQPQESEWTYYTISLKAADEYSRNETIQISQPATQRPFCREGDVIKCKVKLGGYGRRHNGSLFITNTLQYMESLA